MPNPRSLLETAGLAVILALTTTAAGYAGPNLVQNSTFDANLNSWTILGTAAFDSTRDADGSALSGSSMLTAVSTGPTQCSELDQCILLPAGVETVHFNGKALTQAGATAGAAHIKLGATFFTSSDCTTGNLGTSFAFGQPPVTPPEAWIPSGQSTLPAQNALSVNIQQQVCALSAGTVSVNFDDIQFAGVSIAEVPTLGPRGLLLLIGGLVLAALAALRRSEDRTPGRSDG